MKLISEAGYDDVYYMPLGWDLVGEGAPPPPRSANGDDYRDTFNDASETLGVLRIGRTVAGNIEVTGDRDIFAVKLTAGKTYTFDLIGAGAAPNADPYLTLRDAAGVQVAFNDDGGDGLNSRLVFNVQTGGTYYLEARGFDGTAGTYTLAGVETIVDDYRDSFDGVGEPLGTLAVGGTSVGRIEVGRDRDIFAMEVLRGYTYSVRLESTNNGGIADPNLRVLGADGTELVRNDNAGTDTLNSLVTFVARETGTVYVDASASGRTDTGAYRLKAGATAPADDWSDTLDDIRSPVGAINFDATPETGRVEKRGDLDLFAVTVEEGTSYTFDVRRADGSTLDASARLVDAAGNLVAAGTDIGSGPDARVSYAANADATFYLEVSGQNRSRGSYTVTTTTDLPSPPAFDIDLRYTGDERFRAAFEEAEARWEAIITADIPDVNTQDYGLIDDLRIDASVVVIDGDGGILGQAGPDVIRSDSKLPAHGIMQFDSADVDDLLADGSFLGVILHEMGHVLGIGTIWEALGLKASGSFNYTGQFAVAEYRTLANNQSLTTVPLETTGGGGTAGAHWAENVFGEELMTGYATGGLPLSRLTIGGMRDLGYQVDYAEADPYVLPPALTSPGEMLIQSHAVLGMI